MALKETYKDDVFDGNRRYRIVQNEDGTYSFLDVTNYTQEGDLFGAKDVNAITGTVNELAAPTFEDYTGGTEVPSAATALAALKSKIKIPIWMSNVVAFCKGCCTMAMIVNNCVSSDTDKPLSAAQGKALQDQITKQNSDFGILNGLFDFGNTIKFKIETYESNQLVLLFYVSDVAFFRVHFTGTHLGFQYYDGENWSYIWSK